MSGFDPKEYDRLHGRLGGPETLGEVIRSRAVELFDQASEQLRKCQGVELDQTSHGLVFLSESSPLYPFEFEGADLVRVRSVLGDVADPPVAEVVLFKDGQEHVIDERDAEYPRPSYHLVAEPDEGPPYLAHTMYDANDFAVGTSSSRVYHRYVAEGVTVPHVLTGQAILQFIAAIQDTGLVDHIDYEAMMRLH